MNPTILISLPHSWIGDPHQRTLERYFGGMPIIIDPDPIDPDPVDPVDPPVLPIPSPFTIRAYGKDFEYVPVYRPVYDKFFRI
jgi:hypothetical protein